MQRIVRSPLLLISLLFLGALATACGGGSSDAELLLRLQVEGEFVAPDSHAFVNTFEIGGLAGSQEAVIIGDAAWTREGAGEWVGTTRDDPVVEGLIDLSSADPDFLQDQDFVRNLGTLEGEEESINGVDTIRYFIPRETVNELLELFGGALLDDAGGLEDFEMTVWLEVETEGLVRAEFKAAGSSELFDDAGLDIEPGAEVFISLIIDLTQINDDDIAIAAPIEGETAPEPVGDRENAFSSFHYTVEVAISVSE